MQSIVFVGICTLAGKMMSLQNYYCALGLELEVNGNTFSVKRIFEQV